jgi:predicted amidohydrolase
VAEAGDTETTIEADLDPEVVQAYRREFPVLADVDPRFVPGLPPR